MDNTIAGLSQETQVAVARAGYLLVKQEDLIELTRSHRELEALEAAGVDNSEAYGSVNWARVVRSANEKIRRIGLLQARMLGLPDGPAAEHADAFVLQHGSDPEDF